ncbi:hypothetical protein [Coxiella-like endosymbiont of Rhipicephalus sanguineus]|uniref:hypothetical protein n=1 Tax=Coxiella-like endosymbiont of Rhipicephalus sanguineus TaxID=1955402 RepID=UPI00203E53DE|nr:hypothetical protein [Coxiella-like endosymbiont of Rhipicephalus sanguineus]
MKIKILYVLTGLITLLLIEVVALGDAPVVDITQQASGQKTPVEIPTTDTAESSNGSATEITPSDPVVSLPSSR